MIIQGAARTDRIADRADVIVVGTGSGGGTLAAYLAERGWDVVMLEKGAFLRAEEFSQREEEAMGDFNGRRGLDSSTDNAVFLNYAEAVGGSTVHYWGDSFRAPGDRLERWRRESGVDWFTESELDPHWQAIEEELGIHVTPERLFNENNRLVRQGCEALGIEGHAPPTARIDCIGCGWTQFGCTYNRKTSQLITTIPRVSKTGGRIYSDAIVTRLLRDGAGEGERVTGVAGTFVDRATKAATGSFRVEAPVVVLAGGALGTADILLRNMGDDVVGRRFYINPHYFVWADMGRPIDNVTGIPCAYVVHGFRHVQHDAAGEYAGGGYIMLTNHQSPGIASVMLGGHGALSTERMKKYRHLGSLMSVIDEDNPGRVFLDRNGIRRTEYNVRGVDQLKAVDYLRNASRIFLAAGAQEVWIPDVYNTVVRNEDDVRTRITLRSVQPNAQFCAGSHLMGTAPIGSDPADAFAGPTGEAHRLKGLYVADGAALPGSVSVDPSLTIMGVARWIAAGIHERHGREGI
ncbi:MAG TPA: GMC family oxidoreductase N-terminal domain-containing protein [Longimicrobiales bacterium]|nr:GMC family oxidoreductase N-terminal domain-containing protein [Longimicrobiales bacterium]